MAEFTNTYTVNCPDCESDRIVKIGTRNGYQRYQCRGCTKKFSNRLPSHVPAIKAVFPDAQHIPSEGVDAELNNNRSERVQGKFRDRTKTLRGLEGRESGQRYLDGWVFHYNHFKEHHGLNGRTPAEAAQVNAPFTGGRERNQHPALGWRWCGYPANGETCPPLRESGTIWGFRNANGNCKAGSASAPENQLRSAKRDTSRWLPMESCNP